MSENINTIKNPINKNRNFGEPVPTNSIFEETGSFVGRLGFLSDYQNVRKNVGIGQRQDIVQKGQMSLERSQSLKGMQLKGEKLSDERKLIDERSMSFSAQRVQMPQEPVNGSVEDRALLANLYKRTLKTTFFDDAVRNVQYKIKDLHNSEAARVNYTEYLKKLMAASSSLDILMDSDKLDKMKDMEINGLNSFKGLSTVVNKMVFDAARKMRSEKGEQERGKAPVTYKKDRIKKAEKHLGELDSVYKNWRPSLSKDVLSTPEELTRQRLAIFKTYEQDLEVYRASHPDIEKYPEKLKKLFMDYELLKTRMELINWDMQKEGNAEKYKNKSKELALTKAKSLDDKLVEGDGLPDEVDAGLSDKQIESVARIDRWLLRNFNNGGLLRIHSSHQGFVQKVLSLSKRERLYLYYMVEKDARKDATAQKLVESQEYEPNLKAFKAKMLASKFKIFSHLTSKYVYWHKLTQAMQHLTGQREFLRDYAEVQKEASREESEDNGEDREDSILKENNDLKDSNKIIIDENESEENEVEEQKSDINEIKTDINEIKTNINEIKTDINEIKSDINEKKTEKVRKKEEEPEELKQLRELDKDRQKSLKSFYRCLLKLKKADNAKDRNHYKQQADSYYMQMLDYDSRISALNRDTGVPEFAYNRMLDVDRYGKKIVIGGVTKVSKNIDKIADFFFPNSWNVKDWKWDTAMKGSELVSGSSTVLGGVIGVAATVLTMCKGIGAASNFERAEQISALVKGLASVSFSVVKTVDGVNKAAERAADFVNSVAHQDWSIASGAMQITGAVIGSLELGYAGLQGAQYLHNKSKLKSAKEYFQKRNETIEDKTDKEVRFSENLIKLSKNQSKIKRDNALFGLAIGGLTLASLLVPGMGIFALATSIAGLLLTGGNAAAGSIKKNSNIKKSFDTYFDVDSIVAQILEQKRNARELPDIPTDRELTDLEKKKLDRYTDNLRDRVRDEIAANFGFSSLYEATEHIGRQYALYVHDKLLGESAKSISKDEREAFLNLLNSFGLRLNEKKGRPTIAELTSKFSGR